MATQEQIDRLRELSRQVDDLYEEGKETEGAKLLPKALQEAKKIDPAYVLFFRGEQAGYLAKDFSKQESLFRKALSLRPKDSILLRSLGDCLFNQDKEDKAIECYDKALEFTPRDHRTWRNKGVALSKLDKDKEAIACFNQALALNTKDRLTWWAKGVSLSELDKDNEAIACYDKALELNPKAHDSWRQKGVSLSKLGQMDEAIVCYDKALALNPEDHLSWQNKGVTLSKQGKREESLACTEKALALKPGDVDVLVDKAYELYHLGHKQEALALIDEVAKANPKHDYARRVHRYLNILHGKAPAAAPAAAPTPKPAAALARAPQNLQMDDLKAVVEKVRGQFMPFVGEILEKMEKSTEHINNFLCPESRLREDVALFCILRKWNSYTPSIPREDGERSIGGGYFFLVNGVGTVVDPGYNFLENFHRIGGRITDIDNIVVTHAHNDHTADLESILSLVYRFNSDENKDAREKAEAKPKRIRLFLNAGCQMKFSGLIDLRGAEYLEDVQTLMPGHSYDMGEGLALRALRAYHDEVVARKYAVGLDFTLVNKDAEMTRVVITADTGLFPQTKDRKADIHGKQIWEEYHLQPGATHLLVPHLGSVKKEEFSASFSTDPQEVFYANHLGLMGTVQVIAALKPELAVVSEFGEELKDIQPKLIEMIAECVHSFQAKEDEQTVVLPGDLTFLYELRKRSVYCVACQDWVRPSVELVAVPWSDKNNQELFYYHSKAKLGMTKLSVVAEKFQKALAEPELGCLHVPKKPG